MGDLMNVVDLLIDCSWIALSPAHLTVTCFFSDGSLLCSCVGVFMSWFENSPCCLPGLLNTWTSFQTHAAKWDPAAIFITPVGVVGMSLYCLNSGFASVYSEVIMKRNPEPFFVQSIKMYLGGILVNGLLLLISLRQDDATAHQDVFHGFSELTWIIIMTQAVNGLIYGYVLKHASNILRLFIVAVSMLVATFLSIWVFGAEVSISFVLSTVGVLAAVVLFNTSSSSSSPRASSIVNSSSSSSTSPSWLPWMRYLQFNQRAKAHQHEVKTV
eukprot:m.134903 g.134903  ORF g.134903 m.134903 type:complete len:271 (-) comp15830_c0_seq5:36-848(-)